MPQITEKEVKQMNKVLVYCGSSSGNDPAFLEKTRELGKFLAQKGALARSALTHGGKVHGVLPEFMSSAARFNDEELKLTSMTIVPDLHERKKMMFDMADAIIALPGGPGTLDEFSEILCWAYLSLHQKPIGLVDTNGFWQNLNTPFEHFIKAGMMPKSIYNLFAREEDLSTLWDRMVSYKPSDRWLKLHGAGVVEGYSIEGTACKATTVEELTELRKQSGYAKEGSAHSNTQHLRKVAVFLGSSEGTDPAYKATAEKLGKFLAEKNIELVCGAGSYGCMGALAHGCLNNGGKVHGIVPYWMPLTAEGEFVDNNIEFTSLQRVSDMHARKKTVFDMVDAFIVLPGGPGTMDHFFDLFAFKYANLKFGNLSIHDKPIGLVDVKGYWSSIRPLLQSFADNGFMKESVFRVYEIDEDIDKLWQKMLD